MKENHNINQNIQNNKQDLDFKKKKKKKEEIEEENCETCESLGLLKTISKKQIQQKSKNNIENNKNQNEKENQEIWEMKSPPDIIEIGNCGWTLLHTISVYYPKNPSNQKKEDTLQFLKSFSKVYPCNYCAKDFQDILEKNPPKLENQEEFSQWMCEAHNHVNKLLGKPEFDCKLVNKRWKREISSSH